MRAGTPKEKILYVSEPELVSILFVSCNKSQRTLGFTPTHCDYCLDSKTSELSEPSLSLPLLSVGEEGSNLEVSPSDMLFTSLFFFGVESCQFLCQLFREVVLLPPPAYLLQMNLQNR